MKVIFLFLITTLLIRCNENQTETTRLKGKPLPSFNLLLTDSSTYFNTNNIHVGNPTVFFYFGPRCPYSRAQMKDIISDINSFKNVRFYIFTTAPFSEMTDFCEQYQLEKYSNITTGLDYSNFFKDYFEVPGVPYIAIFGKDKRLIKSFIGKINIKRIKEELN